jgi:beta-galactosidase
LRPNRRQRFAGAVFWNCSALKRQSERHRSSRNLREEQWLAGQSAAITRKVGKGRIAYSGMWMDDAGMAAVAEWMADSSGVKPCNRWGPAGVDVYPRYGEHGAVHILVNFSKAQEAISLPRQMSDVLN